MLVVGVCAARCSPFARVDVLLVGGRPTLMSVLFKLSALAFGLYIGSAPMSDRFIAARPDNP